MGVDLTILDDFGLGPQDRAAWLASGLSDDAFEDWLMDRMARRPTGERARAVYGAEDVHDPRGAGAVCQPFVLSLHVELVELGRRAGFVDVVVDNDNGGQLMTGHS